MKKDKAREIVQKRTLFSLDGYRPGLLTQSSRMFRKVCQADRWDDHRRERKPVSVKPKPMYGRWGW